MPYSTEHIEDGIVIGRFIVDQVNLEIAKKALKERLAITNGNSYPTLVDIRMVNDFDAKTKVFLAPKEASTNMTQVHCL